MNGMSASERIVGSIAIAAFWGLLAWELWQHPFGILFGVPFRILAVVSAMIGLVLEGVVLSDSAVFEIAD